LSAQQSRKLNRFRDRYAAMPEDPHLFKGEGERRRRYGRLLIDPQKQTLSIFEHDLFFQAKKFDQLYGDIHRRFAPLDPEDFDNVFFQMLVIDSYRSLPIPKELKAEPFEVSVHMIRIEATPKSGIGRPAPEGIHRDGYHFGSIHLMRRENIAGAHNHIYDLSKKLIDQVTLEQPMDSIYFDDTAIFHGVSPFGPQNHGKRATRDMLILLYQPLNESPQKMKSTQILRSI
jgi:hypothetical protein